MLQPCARLLCTSPPDAGRVFWRGRDAHQRPLQTTLPSPQPVGTPIGLTSLIGMESFSRDTFVFQYSVSVNGGPFRIVQDYSQSYAFAWAPELFEQSATIRVKVRNNETKATGEATLPFQFVSRVKGTAPVVTPTAHPLVALFSAAPCPVGTQFRVAFHAEGEESISRTPIQPCRARSATTSRSRECAPTRITGCVPKWHRSAVKPAPGSHSTPACSTATSPRYRRSAARPGSDRPNQ